MADELRGLVRLSASGVPNGDLTITRADDTKAPAIIRGGAFSVITGGFILSDAEPLFGANLSYRVVDAVTSRYIQSNRVLNTKAAVDTSNTLTGPNRVTARETDPTLVPPRDAVTSFRVPPNAPGVTYQTLEDRLLLSMLPSGFGAGRWYISGQLRYDSPDIWLWDDVKTAGTWQTIKNKGTWQDVKAANSPLAGQPFASLWATVLSPAKSVQEKRRNRVPNPEVAATTTSWFGNAGTGGVVAATRPTTGGPSNNAFYRQTYTTGNTSAAGTDPVSSIVIDGRAASALPIPVVAGTTYSAGIYARSSVAQNLACVLQWYDAAGAVVGVSAVGPAAVVAANTWTRLLSQNAVAPVGALYARVAVATAAGAAVVPFPLNATLDATQGQLNNVSALGTYFTGATAAVGPLTYSWAGTVNASASIESVLDYTTIVAPFQILGVQATDNGGWVTFQGVIDVPGTVPANSRLAFLQGNVNREYTVTWWLSTLMVMPESESLRPGAVLPFFDGDTPVTRYGDPGTNLAPGYDWKALSGDASMSWQGTPNASWSQFLGPSQIFAETRLSIGRPTPDQLPNVKLPIYLSDPIVPPLAMWFELLEIGDLTFSARQQLFDVLSRAAQIAVSQLRSWPSGELRLMTYTLAEASVAERVFSTGRILYLRNPDPRYPENGWYIAVGDTSSGRPGASVSWAPERLWHVPFVKVERPEGLISVATSVSWSQVKSAYTWADLKTKRTDWLDVALTVPT